VQRPELRSLRAFIEEHKPQKAFLVCSERALRCEEGILVIPWREFLDALWSGAVIS
jgi:hypothetical protein